MHGSPTRIAAETFDAWQIIDGATEARVLSVGAAQTLGEAVNATAPQCGHKDTLIIAVVRERSTVLHFYRIKQGKAVWRRKPGFAHAVQVRPLYADPQFRMAVNAFDPVEPWKWTPGSDVVCAPRQEGVIDA